MSVLAITLALLAGKATAAELTLASAPPVVVRTVPVAGATAIDPALTEIRVTFSKPMQDGSWSWSTWGQENFPETTGKPRYLEDGRTCVLPVKLQPGTFYATWLNSEKFRNFKDANGTPAVPYLLTFTTAGQPSATATTTRVEEPGPLLALLNEEQRQIVAWTDRQFRSYFDQRTFAGWTAEEKQTLEARTIDTLKGPRTREYYHAINTLAALQSTNALPKLREIALERRDKDNRDRWMAIRALGLLNDRESIPELIHLVYHGNVNTRWWAQISLVRLTGQNFGSDWRAWGKWWNDSTPQNAFKPEIVRWWSGQPEPDKLAEALAESDAKFLASLKERSKDQ